MSRKAAMCASLIRTTLVIDCANTRPMPKAQATPGKTLLSPTDHTLIMIDHQSQMSFATKSIDAVHAR